MTKIIDIEALSKMPITDEFANILFGENSTSNNVEMKFNLKQSNGLSVTSIKQGVQYMAQTEFGRKVVHISPLGDISKLDELYAKDGVNWVDFKYGTLKIHNAFQIVRYIDNYLNEQKKIAEILLPKKSTYQ